jgi:hypothetical protein
MNTEKVVSREYKVMLRAKLFAGGEDDLLKVAGKFWHEFKDAIDKTALGATGDLEKIAKKRTIKFYDTNKHLLDSNSYIFRERGDIDSGEKEVTLKFRHVDRYISQDRNMSAGDSDRGKTKFEEDIKFQKDTTFVTLYSFSTTQTISNSKNLNRMKDVALLYPDVQDRLADYDEDDSIEVLRGFTARELVIVGAEFQIGKNPRLDSECALIVWYDNSRQAKVPEVVEFSFKYGSKNGEYNREVAYRSYEVFQILQTGLSAWIDRNSKTKTAFVYVS